jgi:hypothetical protein
MVDRDAMAHAASIDGRLDFSAQRHAGTAPMLVDETSRSVGDSAGNVRSFEEEDLPSSKSPTTAGE